MLREVLILILIMFLPLIEIRLAIPVGILEGSVSLPFVGQISAFGFNPIFVFLLSIFAGLLLAIIVFNLLHLIDNPLKKSRFAKPYFNLLDRTQKKVKPYVDKYGVFGLALFIAVPIPGSGVYMGSLGGYILGFEKKKFYLASLIGVFIAATIVTLLTVIGSSIF